MNLPARCHPYICEIDMMIGITYIKEIGSPTIHESPPLIIAVHEKTRIRSIPAQFDEISPHFIVMIWKRNGNL